MFPNLLPLGLVDLTLARTFVGLNAKTAVSCAIVRARALHHETLAVKLEQDDPASTLQSFVRFVVPQKIHIERRDIG